MSAKCPYCGGLLLGEDNRYCPHCGKEFPKNEVTTVEKDAPVTKDETKNSSFEEKRPLFIFLSITRLVMVYAMLILLFVLVYEKDVASFFGGNNVLLYLLLLFDIALLGCLFAQRERKRTFVFILFGIQSAILVVSFLYAFMSIMTYVSGLNGGAFASPLAAPLIYWLYLFSSFIIFGISLGSVIAFIPEVKYAKSHEK